MYKAHFPYGQPDAVPKVPTSPPRPTSKHSVLPAEAFLDMRESPPAEQAPSEKSTASPKGDDGGSDAASSEKGYTFDQLVDRLLAQPLSKADYKFAAIFLALYRKFAAPCQLLDAIISRFKALYEDRRSQMIKTIAQLRYLSIIEQWVRSYPGDFAQPVTLQRMTKFVKRLAGIRIFSVAAREMQTDLELVVEDDDTDWACCDHDRLQNREAASFLEHSSSEEDLANIFKGSTFGTEGAKIVIRDSTTSSRSNPGSMNSSSQTKDSVEAARHDASLLVPNPRIPCTKGHWRQLMEIPEEIIAKELTRMDWIMFSSIRPRDLVRHVSLSGEDKKRCKDLANVDRIIAHFNHLAFWVANYVLLRDKPKHRAQMLEKVMKLARVSTVPIVRTCRADANQYGNTDTLIKETARNE
jgi:hypothetical protein